MNINMTSYNTYSPSNGYSGGYLGANSGNPTGNQPQNKTQPNQGTAIGNASVPHKSQTAAAITPDSQNTQASDSTTGEASKEKQPPGSNKQLSQAELQLLTELKQIDTEVRNHEMAHVAAGGSLITSGASFTYKKGPDGNSYAVAGEVGIDTSAIPGDPRATLQKMQQVKRAAIAPASPSAQDLKVASKASAMAAKASSELTMLMAKGQSEANEEKAFGNLKQASDSYTKVNNLPEENSSTFELAV